jgi:hypothetical protein
MAENKSYNDSIILTKTTSIIIHNRRILANVKTVALVMEICIY